MPKQEGNDETMLAGDSGGEEMLSLDEAAQFLNISKPTLYRLLGQGAVKGLKAGKQWRFRRADLRAYMEREPLTVAAPPADLLDAEIAFFAEELRRMGAAAAALPEDDTEPGSRKIDLLARQIYHLAIGAGASDIHLEPEGQHLRLRIRIDGLLHEVRRMPRRLHEALMARYKEMAALNTAERRSVQEGRILVPVGGKEFDLRVSCVAALHGETIVMRVLDRSSVLIGLDKLGLTPQDREQIESWTTQPNGLIVATGPTGTGKTTLLYSLLHQINDVGRKIVTVEDPVEYQLSGTVQIAVNKKVGLTFPVALRAVLRQDPDALMVAETPDVEAARTVYEAALTGHLVLTTLNAGSAGSAARWLVDMGIEPLLVSRSLVGIVAQRLARRICPECRIPAEISLSDPIPARLSRLAAIGGYDLPEETVFQRGAGCEKCRGRGYRGRVGIFEAMPFSPELRDALLRGASAEEMESIAVEQGMRTLVADGVRKAAEGVTTLEEAMRVTL